MLGLLEACSSYKLHKVTIQVSDSGLDEPSCLQNEKSCKTLSYVLSNLPNITSQQSTSITVNVTCNQTVKTNSYYSFTQKYHMSVRVISHNKAYITLNSCMEINNYNHELYYENKHWTWIGIGFISSNNSYISYYSFSSLFMLNCKIMEVDWKFDFIEALVIKDSEFGQVDICPTLNITSINLSRLQFIFSNNTVSDCRINNSIWYFPDSLKATDMKFTIMNCIFTKLKGIQRTTTGRNFEVLQKDSKIISVQASENFDLSINESYFTDNSQLIPISINVFSGLYDNPMTVQLTIHKTILRNNSATSVLVEFNCHEHYYYYTMAVVLKDMIIDGNTVTNTQSAYALPVGDLETSLFSFSTIDYVSLEDLSFSDNQGSPIVIKQPNEDKTRLSVGGEVLFTNNTGVLGGACGLHNVHVMIKTTTEVNVVFENNSAVYGGALYLNKTTISDARCKLKANFINNKATTSGNSVYFASTPQGAIPNCSFIDIQRADINSPARNIKYAEHIISLIPGQNIYLNVSVTDFFGLPSSCTADVYIFCDNWLFICIRKQVRLNGPDHVVLAQNELGVYAEVDTKLSVSAPQVLGNTDVYMRLICRNDVQTGIAINLNISMCPLGFVYNTSEGVCKCANITANHGNVICSEYLGVACITQGYWYGPFDYDNSTAYISAQCSYPDCSSYYYKPCPAKILSLIGFAGDYSLLGADPDEQCTVGRGGLLCKSCAQDYQYTFLSVSCVASSTCEWWQPYLVLVITLVFQLMIAMALMIVVRFKIAAGSGFLYGPMLFIAIISHLPLDYEPNFFVLRTSILFITAVPLLNPEPFGLIPWCFFHPFIKIYNYSLRYLGPLTVLLVISFATLKARWCPRTLLKWQNSRLRALCILMLLSFWSLADITMNITFNILTSTRLIHNNDVVVSVVALEPQIKYFSWEHIPIVVLALLVLLIVIIPLLVVLLISPALSRVINLTRIKPFLDEFQSCYRDSCRWYSIVYFIVWIGFVSMQSQAVPMVYIQTLFMILLSTHCLIHPYQSTVLNMTDALILIDINFLIALLQSKTNLTTIVLVHILVFVPILCIGAWFVGVTLVKCGVCRYLNHILFKRRQQPSVAVRRERHYEERLPSPPNVPVHVVHLYESNEEREPLIGIVDDN